MAEAQTGLSSAAAAKLFKEFGPNEIPQKRGGGWRKLSGWLLSPVALMLLGAALLSLYIGKQFDFYFILALMALNFLIGAWQERRADRAIEKLNERLATKSRVLRDNAWTWIASRRLVPGDAVEAGTGDVITADGEILDAKNCYVNEAVLTGESLPREKTEGGEIYSGSFVSTGLAVFRVTATGGKTRFGKTALLVDRSRRPSALEEDILRISKFLSVLSVVVIAGLSIVFIIRQAAAGELLTLDLSLLIAGVPVSLPTVMTLVIELGVLGLARKESVVRRLSSLEDLANVNLLLTDKTGTLTKNEITVHDVIAYGEFGDAEIIRAAYISAVRDDRGDVSRAIVNRAKADGLADKEPRIVDFIPSDSTRKRSSALAEEKGGRIFVSVGAPQVIIGFCAAAPELRARFDRDVAAYAARGYRTLAVAKANGRSANPENNMILMGLLTLSDALREDAADVIGFMQGQGIGVKMVTGDNRAIAEEISGKLGLKGDVISREEIANGRLEAPDVWNQAAAFAEVLPEDKYTIVKAAKEKFTVAATGDGVNDLPALREASVGIAVQNAVDALKAGADIVLLGRGISAIKDAVIESRKIFARLYTYSMYRISESLRLIITIAILGLAYGLYPLTPLQLILIALLNDIPIISLAYDRVKVPNRPAKINVRERFALSSLFGLVGVANSILLFLLMRNVMHLPWAAIQTAYFLKLTVSGHMLIYVAHTKERWFRFLPSREVIWATTVTQIAATFLAVGGIFMPGPISLSFALFIWAWSLIWMQITEAMKEIEAFYRRHTQTAGAETGSA